jgi:PleD family two-component response regulator
MAPVLSVGIGGSDATAGRTAGAGADAGALDGLAPPQAPHTPPTIQPATHPDHLDHRRPRARSFMVDEHFTFALRASARVDKIVGLPTRRVFDR